MQLYFWVVYRVFEGDCGSRKILLLVFAPKILVIWPVLVHLLTRIFQGDFQNILIDIKCGILSFLFDFERGSAIIHYNINGKLRSSGTKDLFKVLTGRDA